MTDAAARYEDLMRRLLDGRSRGRFEGSGEADEDRLLEARDDCWWAMSEAEQQESERRLDEAQHIAAPEVLGDDVGVEVGGRALPRRAA